MKLSNCIITLIGPQVAIEAKPVVTRSHGAQADSFFEGPNRAIALPGGPASHPETRPIHSPERVQPDCAAKVLQPAGKVRILQRIEQRQPETELQFGIVRIERVRSGQVLNLLGLPKR